MARRRRHEEHENHERWLVSYADFITLLFAFFVVLYATSQQDVKKEEEFEKSVRKHLMGVFGFGSSGTMAGEMDANVAIPPPITNVFPPMGAGSEEIQDYVQGKINEDLTDEEKAQTDAQVRHDTLGVRIQLAASALFPSGSANLKESAFSPLAKIAELLRESNRKILIEGHTDNDQIQTARFPSNWELSAARSTKIVRYLIQRHGIPGNRLVGVAYGDQKPVAPNDTEVNKAKNRRIEILIVTGDTPL